MKFKLYRMDFILSHDREHFYGEKAMVESKHRKLKPLARVLSSKVKNLELTSYLVKHTKMFLIM